MKKYLAVLLVVMLIVTISFVGCKTTTADTTAAATTAAATTAAATTAAATTAAGETTAAAAGTRNIADREDVTVTTPIVEPDVFPAGFLPGIDSVGVVPLKKYKIAFSNGDMGDVWRQTFLENVKLWGQKYADAYGIEFVWASSGNDSAAQLAQAESLLAQQPDLLIISPNETEPLSPILLTAEAAGIPVIALDRELAAKEGEGAYLAIITMDYFLNGYANGVAIIDQLTKKYGKPIGNVVELAGILGSSPGILRSQGLNWAFKDYPDIRIMETRPMDFDRKKGYELTKDLLVAYKAGEIDVIHASCDAGGLGALEAVKEAGRTELLGYIHGIDGDTPALEAILKGEYGSSHECAPWYGLVAMEYAIRYLNGEDISSRIMLPTRWFYPGTAEQKAEIERLWKYASDNDLPFPPLEIGGHEILSNPKTYTTPYWEDPAMTADKPYQTKPAIDTSALQK
jgi:ABC-type sugar transport system substrate-binding protein